jgi:hypothetical protein
LQGIGIGGVDAGGFAISAVGAGVLAHAASTVNTNTGQSLVLRGADIERGGRRGVVMAKSPWL